MLVSLPIEVLSVAEALDLYRARRQIELFFKRLKSLFQLGHVPKRSDASARAWIEGKLLTALLIERLIERLIDEAKLFPLGDSRSRRRSHWMEFLEARDSVLAVLGRPLLPSHFLRSAPLLGALLACPPRKRLMWNEKAWSEIKSLG